jgi:membrane protease YdiL (CAAX protease family)
VVKAGLFNQEAGFQSQYVSPLITIAVGVLLWYSQSLNRLLGPPIVQFLQTIGLLAPSAQAFESQIASAMLIRWVAMALLLLFVIGVERLPLRSIGLYQPKSTDLYWAAVAGWLGAIVGIGLFLLVQGFPSEVETAADQTVDRLSRLGQLNLILNAAIVEEVFFRGLLIERMTAITRRAWVGGLVSFALFIAVHLTGSGLTESLTIVMVSTLVFTLLYWWRRNLVLCMVAHFSANAPTLLN